MRAQPFKQTTSSAHPPMIYNDIVQEALDRQAAFRPQRKPPRQMPVTPTLPRMPKPHRRRGK